MKFVISRHELANLIRKIQHVVPQTAPVPILSHFLVEATQGTLVFTATDLMVGTRCRSKAMVAEEGALSIPSRHFFQLIRELTDTDIEVTSDAKVGVEIKAGSSRFRLHGMDKSEYPALPDLADAAHFQIESATLKEMFYRTAFAVSKEDNRYALTGVLLRIQQGRAIFVGTDGKRLAKTETPVSLQEDFSGEYILPLKAVDEIMKMLTESESATVYLTEDKVGIESGSTILITKLLAGTYPDFQQIIATQSALSMQLHREELIVLLRQISLFTADSSNSVRFTFLPGELTLTANSSAVGEGKVSMPVNYNGAKLEIAFNPYYFLDVLKHTKDETVTLKLSDSFNPGVITDSTTTLYVIMPMRLLET